MKLLDSFTSKLKKQQKEPEELFLTLIVDSDHVAGACWHMQDAKSANLTHAVSRKITVDSWEERTKAADEIITALEDRSGTTDIHKVIFGFPASYLTGNGDIDKTIRSELKTFTHELDLTAIGFVPVHQALIYSLKKQDGVPPTVIVFGIYKKEIVIALYKVGVCVGLRIIPNTRERIPAIEMALKGFVDVEVLPSRILLYGADTGILEDFRVEMINHPWPTRANFLHFPKVVILPPDSVVSGVSHAGSSELTVTPSSNSEEKFPVSDPQKKNPEEPQSFISDKEESIQGIETEQFIETVDTTEPEFVDKTETISSEDNKSVVEDAETQEEKEESNVRVVTPEEIGFHTNEDIIEMGNPKPRFAKSVPIMTPEYESEDEDFDEPQKIHNSTKSMGTFFSSGLTAVSLIFSGILRKILTMKLKIVPIGIGGIILLGVIFWLIVAVFPRVDVTITVMPRQIESSSSAIIDSTATAVDEKTLTIQGEKLEKTVSGEKTVAVTGKKNIGDPAKGTVTVYNKSLVPRTFKKGTVISTKNLQFTLDDDVEIASASQTNIDTLTFGKGTVGVSASVIGTQSNISANNDFNFKDISESVAIARNEQPFSGGTSKEVTVVSRADQEKLIAQITPELIEKAKLELSAGVAGTKKLIEETIKTTVAEKTFTEELNQETSDLHGKVSMSVTGIAYDEQILKDVLFEKVKTSVPTGYELLQDAVTVTVGKMTVKKNGTISVTVSISGKAKPFLNITELKKMIAGKNITDATKTLRELTGVSDVATQFSYALFKQKIPKESNISISIKE